MFTTAVMEGLETGEADGNQDGQVGLDELYEYAWDKGGRPVILFCFRGAPLCRPGPRSGAATCSRRHRPAAPFYRG